MPFLSRMPLPALIAAFLFATLFLSACDGGGAKSVDAEDWVADVCERFIEFDEDGEEIAGEFFDIDFDDPEEAKKGVLAFLADTKKAFDRLEADFEKLGQPGIDGGSAVTEAFLANFKSVEKDIDSAIKKIKALDTDTDDFEADVMEVFDGIEDVNFRDVLEKLADKKDDVWEIVDLIDEDPECAAVIFDDEDSAADDGAQPSPTVRAGGAATPVKTSTAVARTTPKANASKNERFVIGLCSAMTGWLDDVTALVDSLSVPPNSSATQLKEAMVAYFQEALDLATNLKKALAGLPVPEIKDGKAVHQAFAQLGEGMERSFADILAKAKAMEAKSPSQVQADVQAFADDLDLVMTEMSLKADTIDLKYDTDALVKIADQVTECEGIF
ncbi:MAG: hypothetical protein HS107_13670 [Thermoflexaceae bacterium]|nr:hypothetical protein [Thermoflexaceae bacterium]